MCDELEILNREIERLLQSSSVEGSTKSNSDCLQTSLTDSDVITGSDSGAKYELEQVFNVVRYRSRVSQTRLFILSFFFFPQVGIVDTVYIMYKVLCREGIEAGDADVDLVI